MNTASKTIARLLDRDVLPQVLTRKHTKYSKEYNGRKLHTLKTPNIYALSVICRITGKSHEELQAIIDTRDPVQRVW